MGEIRKSIADTHVCLAVTGVGQDLLLGLRGTHGINEIVATARAAAYLFPGIRTVVDIGGQFSKWILLAGSEPNPWEVRDFAANGLCAAGTGAFLEQQANRLRISVDKLGKIAGTAPKGCSIAGRCTVFAKSDMIHLQQNIDRLAAEGIRFTRAFNSNAVCSPTRATYIAFLFCLISFKGKREKLDQVRYSTAESIEAVEGHRQRRGLS